MKFFADLGGMRTLEKTRLFAFEIDRPLKRCIISKQDFFKQNLESIFWRGQNRLPLRFWDVSVRA